MRSGQRFGILKRVRARITGAANCNFAWPASANHFCFRVLSRRNRAKPSNKLERIQWRNQNAKDVREIPASRAGILSGEVSRKSVVDAIERGKDPNLALIFNQPLPSNVYEPRLEPSGSYLGMMVARANGLHSGTGVVPRAKMKMFGSSCH
jgi:hypothetical protein